MKYQKCLSEYKDFHVTKLKLDEKILLLTEQNQSYQSQLNELPERIISLETGNQSLQKQLQASQDTVSREQKTIEELRFSISQIREKFPMAEEEFKRLLNKEKELVLLNQELQEKNQILIDLNRELGLKNDQLNNQLLTLREKSEQSDIKKSIFYQKKANELESRILMLTEDLQQQKTESTNLQQSIQYLNELQQFFDANYIQVQSNAKNEQQLTEKVKILAKQMELAMKGKISMQSRICELEDFIIMLIDENQDATKAVHYLNLRNRQIRKSDIVRTRCANCGAMFTSPHAQKPDASTAAKSPVSHFTLSAQQG